MRWGDERGDVRGHITGHISAGITKYHSGELVAARSDLEHARSMLESCEADPTVVWDPVRSFGRESILAIVHGHIQRPVCWLGYPDQALAHAAAAIEGYVRLAELEQLGGGVEEFAADGPNRISRLGGVRS
jgi:hypothetical protein